MGGEAASKAALAAGRCPVCHLTDCDTVGEQSLALCRCGLFHTGHQHADCLQFRTT